MNDKPDLFYQETYEAVIRKLLTWSSEPAVILLNNVRYDTGESAQKYHIAVGDWYQVPHVSIRETLYQRMWEGMYAREELTPDGLHPNDKGHELVAAEIISFLEYVRAHKNEKESENPVPDPVTANAYEDAKRLTIREISPQLQGFQTDTREKTGHLDFFKNGWVGKKTGDKILFETDASCIAVQYRKTVKKPACRAKLILDGDTEHAKVLDGNFEEDWGDCLYLEPVLHHGEKKTHTIEIEIINDETEDATPFYLLALITA